MAITQTIATLPAVLNDSATFYEDIAERNNSLVTTILPSINAWATQANTTQTEINAKALQVAAQAVDGGYSQDYINDNFVNQDINTLTNKTTPVDADEMVIADGTSSFSLKKLSFSNLKDWLKTLFIQKDYVIVSGSATFSPTLNTIVLTGIGSLGLKIGDVISISGSTGNNKTFNIEHINGDGSGLVTDNNTIIVNYEHRGSSTPVPSKRLISETATVSITLITNPKEFEGLGWCTPARSSGATYTVNIGRPIVLIIRASSANSYPLSVSNTIAVYIGGNDVFYSISVPVPNGETYVLGAGAVFNQWNELR